MVRSRDTPMGITCKLKGKASLYRMAGIIGSFLHLMESIIWIVLCIVGIIYCFTGAAFLLTEKIEYETYGYVLTMTYFNLELPSTACVSVSSNTNLVLLGIYLLLSINVVIASTLLYLEFDKWRNSKQITLRVRYWLVSVIIMSIFELIAGCMFLADYFSCSGQDDNHKAAAALTLAAFYMKGFLIWLYNAFLFGTLIYVQFIMRKAK